MRANRLPQNCLVIFTVLCSEEKVQLTGIYDLVAVLTHKGRSADLCLLGETRKWCVFGKLIGSFMLALLSSWIQYDDHNPIPQRVERILQSYPAAVSLFKRNHTGLIYFFFFFSLLNKLSQTNHITFFGR